MNDSGRRKLWAGAVGFLAVAVLAGLMINAWPAHAQQNGPAGERWLHVRVDGNGKSDEMVRISVPVSLAEKIVGSVNHDRLHYGHISLGNADLRGVDLRAILSAVQTSKDGEFVTVKDRDEDVRVAKQDGYLIVHVTDGDSKARRPENVEVHVPLTVVNAVLGAGGQDLDIAAGLHALSNQGDTELISVKDAQESVRVWLDSKSTMD
jgi:hypothetical protein